MILDFVGSNQKTFAKNIQKINNIDRSNDLILDYVTLRDLEITKSISGNDDNTLFSFMNETSTPMGARLLRNWLITPTQNIETINDRHTKLDWMIDNKVNLYDLKDVLKKISDLERLINRIENKTCNYRDLISLFPKYFTT